MIEAKNSSTARLRYDPSLCSMAIIRVKQDQRTDLKALASGSYTRTRYLIFLAGEMQRGLKKAPFTFSGSTRIQIFGIVSLSRWDLHPGWRLHSTLGRFPGHIFRP